jgi:hypothetical protein
LTYPTNQEVENLFILLAEVKKSFTDHNPVGDVRCDPEPETSIKW